ncbi:hypothetical protein ABC345_21300 [Shouchella sp. 1P09AA]|uniref:hypothetical protein n=1 Tax=unclassified Shouchella TaxID=2893065 RepID=UPI0039A127F9
MYILDLNYTMEKYEETLVILDIGKNEIVFACKVRNINFDKFAKLVYYGISIDNEENDNEFKLLNVLIEKNSSMFLKKDVEDSDFYFYARKYYEMHKYQFRQDTFSFYAESVKNFTKKFKIGFLACESFNPLISKLNNLPFLEVNTALSTNKLDLLIVDTNVNCQQIDQLCENVLFISKSDSEVNIGPLIKVDDFRIPELSDSYETPLFESELNLVSLFLERISYIVLFSLYDKITNVPYLPNRYILRLSRSTLTLNTDELELIPNY